MKKISCFAIASLCAALSSAFAQGSLTPPPGAPVPVFKTLAQIEPRTPISAAPFTISNSGAYYLTTNLTAVSNGIVITANGVTLDLGGWTISSAATPAAGYAVMLVSGIRDVTIMNGHIRGGVTNNGSGVFSGPGFMYGICGMNPTFAVNALVERVSVSGCLKDGIVVSGFDTAAVAHCTVRSVGGYGIIGTVIRESVAEDTGSTAIDGSQISDCRGQAADDGDGVKGDTILNCNGNSVSGRGVYAYTVQNCRGYSSSGDGVYALETCQGSTGGSSSGMGINCQGTAMNCTGFSITGTGIYAHVASFCQGSRQLGTAIQAQVATGCYATDGTNKITSKYNMP